MQTGAGCARRARAHRFLMPRGAPKSAISFLVECVCAPVCVCVCVCVSVGAAVAQVRQSHRTAWFFVRSIACAQVNINCYHFCRFPPPKPTRSEATQRNQWPIYTSIVLSRRYYSPQPLEWLPAALARSVVGRPRPPCHLHCCLMANRTPGPAQRNLTRLWSRHGSDQFNDHQTRTWRPENDCASRRM